MLPSRARRGAAAIEFALTSVVYFLLMFAVVDWGWVLFDQVNVENATAAAARAGGVSDTPVETAAAVAAEKLASFGIDPATATVETQVWGVAPYQQIDVTITAPYTAPVPWLGLPMPDTVAATSTAHVEVQ